MKVYLAGNSYKDVWQYVPRRLMSYFEHGYQTPKNLPTSEALSMAGKDLFLDSGAFSAWVRKESIPVGKLIDYWHASKDLWLTVAALDVIGDEVATWANYELMRKEGVPCIPTFHYGEPWDVLRKMVDTVEYMAFGGLVGVPSAARKSWLNEAWRLTCDAKGFPRIKVHGFGVTTVDLMTTFPWHSVDSTSWVKRAAFGTVFFPLLDGTLVDVVFSAHSPEARKLDGRHYTSLNEAEKHAVDEALTALGTDAEACSCVGGGYLPRCVINAKTYQSFESKGVDRFTMQQPTFDLG